MRSPSTPTSVEREHLLAPWSARHGEKINENEVAQATACRWLANTRAALLDDIEDAPRPAGPVG